jgi:hypothetical protein
VVITGDGYYRLQFADIVALTIAIGRHTPGRFREDARRTQEGSSGVGQLRDRRLDSYLRARALESGVPLP